MAQQPLDDRNRAAFFRAVGTIEQRLRAAPRAERGRQRHAPSDQALARGRADRRGHACGSDYEAATFLLEVLKQNGIEGAARARRSSRRVAGVGSGYERGRVLQAVVKKPGASSDTLREVLRATAGMSGYELSQLLQPIARTHPLTGDLRDAYLAAADRLSGYEQGQVLAALVKNERTRR